MSWKHKNNFSGGGGEDADPLKKAQKGIVIQLLSEEFVLLTGAFGAFTDLRKDIIKKVGGSWYQEKKGWRCHISSYKTVFEQLERTGATIKGIPDIAFQAMIPLSDRLDFKKGKQSFQIIYPKELRSKSIDQLIPREIVKNLYGFQREGVQFGLQNYGRVLIADEMGVGKTIQAICLAACYKSAWPLAIFCPSSLKYNWKDEILKWDPSLRENQVQIIVKAADEIYLSSQVLICSYDIIPKIEDKLLRFKANIAISDEAHYLKNPLAKRTKVILPYLQKLKHVILLTGTPAFARPREMFTQLSIVRPDVFGSFTAFGDRYCDPRPAKFGSGLDYMGSTNEQELHYVLKKNIMIRRLKSEVLSQLPKKRRKKVIVNVDASIVREIQNILRQTCKTSLEQLFESAYNQKQQQLPSDEVIGVEKTDSLSAFQALLLCYRLSAMAKLEELKSYISDLLENQTKLIIFAHHQDILNAIETYVNDVLRKQSIRIDGRVQAKDRHDRVEAFQKDPKIMVAVLSLTAASTGLTLTASSNIVFAEMHWTPALIQQAEDRAHRIGQENSVICHYIIGEKTLDGLLYKKIEQKLAVVSNILDGQRKLLHMDSVQEVNGEITEHIEVIPLVPSNQQKLIQKSEKGERIQVKGNGNPCSTGTESDKSEGEFFQSLIDFNQKQKAQSTSFQQIGLKTPANSLNSLPQLNIENSQTKASVHRRSNQQLQAYKQNDFDQQYKFAEVLSEPSPERKECIEEEGGDRQKKKVEINFDLMDFVKLKEYQPSPLKANSVGFAAVKTSSSGNVEKQSKRGSSQTRTPPTKGTMINANIREQFEGKNLFRTQEKLRESISNFKSLALKVSSDSVQSQRQQIPQKVNHSIFMSSEEKQQQKCNFPFFHKEFLRGSAEIISNPTPSVSQKTKNNNQNQQMKEHAKEPEVKQEKDSCIGLNTPTFNQNCSPSSEVNQNEMISTNLSEEKSKELISKKTQQQNVTRKFNRREIETIVIDDEEEGESIGRFQVEEKEKEDGVPVNDLVLKKGDSNTIVDIGEEDATGKGKRQQDEEEKEKQRRVSTGFQFLDSLVNYEENMHEGRSDEMKDNRFEEQKGIITQRRRNQMSRQYQQIESSICVEEEEEEYERIINPDEKKQQSIQNQRVQSRVNKHQISTQENRKEQLKRIVKSDGRLIEKQENGISKVTFKNGDVLFLSDFSADDGDEMSDEDVPSNNQFQPFDVDDDLEFISPLEEEFNRNLNGKRKSKHEYCAAFNLDPSKRVFFEDISKIDSDKQQSHKQNSNPVLFKSINRLSKYF